MEPFGWWSDSCYYKKILLREDNYSISCRSPRPFVLFDCPFVCGWKAVLRSRHIPRASWKAFQKWDVNCDPRSDIIGIGTPWSLTISSIYSWAYWEALKVILIRRKCADLVILSTITHTESKPMKYRHTKLMVCPCVRHKWDIDTCWTPVRHVSDTRSYVSHLKNIIFWFGHTSNTTEYGLCVGHDWTRLKYSQNTT